MTSPEIGPKTVGTLWAISCYHEIPAIQRPKHPFKRLQDFEILESQFKARHQLSPPSQTLSSPRPLSEQTPAYHKELTPQSFLIMTDLLPWLVLSLDISSHLWDLVLGCPGSGEG